MRSLSVLLSACAAALLAHSADALGVLAKLQGATEDGFACDAECVHEMQRLHQASNGRQPQRGPAADEPLILTKLLSQVS